jgi:DNA-directed RNA polymerase subunit M/transcription elongation factor TFIIS
MSIKTSKLTKIDEDESDSDEQEIVASDDSSDEEPDQDNLSPKEKVSDEDEEYQPQQSDSDGEKSEDEKSENEDELEDLFGISEEDIVPEDNPDIDEEVPIELEGDDEGRIFEDSRKKKGAPRRKETKRRLFPFIQKKRRMSQVEARDAPEYHSLEVRNSTREFFLSSLKIEEKEVVTSERSIFNASVRATTGEDLTIDSIEFKRKYLEIVRYFIGAYGKIKKSEILAELKQDIHSSKSVLFSKAREAEKIEHSKIRNPTDVEENISYPCPKCKGIKAFRSKRQLRGGDEGQSMLLWCVNKTCQHHWRING